MEALAYVAIGVVTGYWMRSLYAVVEREAYRRVLSEEFHKQLQRSLRLKHTIATRLDSGSPSYDQQCLRVEDN